MNRNPRYNIDAQVDAVLRFDQFYARRLHEEEKAEAVDRELSLLQRRMLRELLLRPCAGAFLSWRLDADPGHVSRALGYMQLLDLVTLSPEKDDGRRRTAALTRIGERVARDLQQFHQDRVREFLEGLPRRQRWRLVVAMRAIVEVYERDPIKNIVDKMLEDRERARS